MAAANVVAALAANPRRDVSGARHAATHPGIRAAPEPGDVVGLRLEAAAPPSGELSHAQSPLESLRWIAGIMPAGVLRGYLVRQVAERVTSGEKKVDSHLWSD